MADLKGILENLCKVEGVEGAFLVGTDGVMIESVFKMPHDTEFIGNLAYRCITSGKKIAEALDKSPLNQSYLEFEDISLTLDLLSNGSILALLAGTGANLGRIRLEIRKNKKSVESISSNSEIFCVTGLNGIAAFGKTWVSVTSL